MERVPETEVLEMGWVTNINKEFDVAMNSVARISNALSNEIERAEWQKRFTINNTDQNFKTRYMATYNMKFDEMDMYRVNCKRVNQKLDELLVRVDECKNKVQESIRVYEEDIGRELNYAKLKHGLVGLAKREVQDLVDYDGYNIPDGFYREAFNSITLPNYPRPPLPSNSRYPPPLPGNYPPPPPPPSYSRGGKKTKKIRKSRKNKINK